MAKKAYIGINGAARKVKKGYVGVSGRDFFTKAKLNESANCTVSNGTVTQTVADTATSPYWKWRIWKTDGSLVHFGTSYDISGLVSASFVKDSTCTVLDFGINGAVRDTIVRYDVSSLPNGTYTVSAQMLNSTQGSISWNNMKFVLEDSVAFKIKKAYIGIGGVARPFWSGGELAYYGTITGLSMPRRWLAATTVGNYALFGGGYINNSSYPNRPMNTVDAYSLSLTRSNPTELAASSYYLVATTVGNYALFGGGNPGPTNRVTAYDSSLTRTVPTALKQARTRIGATTVGNYALFGGGYAGSANRVIDAYNLSLTRTNPTGFDAGMVEVFATTVGDYALFSGMHENYKSSPTYAYNSSLTKTIPTALSEARQSFAATTVGNYALFGGGYSYSSSGTTALVEAYNSSLTRTTTTSLSGVSQRLSATTVGNYALFGGGWVNSSTNSAVVNAYDPSLTRTIPTGLSEGRGDLSATTVGNYALFGGGYVISSVAAYQSFSATVNAYVVA